MRTYIIKVTNGCNLRCAYCSVGDKADVVSITEEQLRSNLEFIGKQTMSLHEEHVAVIFHGGEPTLIPTALYETVLTRIEQEYPCIAWNWKIQTNGFALSAEQIQLFRKHRFGVGISIDGDAYHHDRVRCSCTGQPTFAAIQQNILRLKAEGISVSALMVLTADVSKGEYAFLDWFEEHGVPLKINPLLQCGEAVSHPEFTLPPGAYADYLIGAFRYSIKRGFFNIQIEPITSLFYRMIGKQSNVGCEFSENCFSRFYAIDMLGEIYPCGRFADGKQYPLGNVSRVDVFPFIAQTQSYPVVVQQATCSQCPYRELCNAGCPFNALLNGEISLCQDYRLLFQYLHQDALAEIKRVLLERRNVIVSALSHSNYDLLLLNIERTEAKLFDNIGQHIIAAYLEQKHFTARVYSGTFPVCKKIICDAIEKDHVPVLGFYVAADNLALVEHLIQWLKKNYRITIFVGGPQAVALKREFLERSKCDFVVEGEGEVPVHQLLQAILKRSMTLEQVHSLRYIDAQGNYQENALAPLMDDLDALPFPSRRHCLKSDFRNHGVMGLITGRGCPFQCAFCYEGANSKTVRLRSIANVMAEIDSALSENPKIQYLNIYDDTFTLSYERVHAFCQEIKKRNLQWFCEAHVSTILKNPEMLREMIDAGLVSLQIGVESGSDHVLAAYRKRITVDMLLQTVQLCYDAGLVGLYGNFIIGGAHETEETIRQSMELAEKMLRMGRGMFECKTVYMAPYPQTAISRSPEKFHLIMDSKLEEQCLYTMYAPLMRTEGLPMERLIELRDAFDRKISDIVKEMARNATKSDLKHAFKGGVRKLATVSTWKSECLSHEHIILFLNNHLYAAKSETDFAASEAYPIRTIQMLHYSNGLGEYLDYRFDEIETRFLELATGKMTLSEIACKLNVTLERLSVVYESLHERCLVYLSEC